MRLSAVHYGIIVLVLFTAAMHFGAAFDAKLVGRADVPDPLFTLNGLGYLGLLGAYFLPIPLLQQNHGLVRWALIIYVVATIVAWLIIFVGESVIAAHQPFFGRDSMYGVPAKIAEVLLLVLLTRDHPS